MPDTQTDTPSPAGADIGALINSATPPGLRDKLTDIRRDQSASTDKITTDTDRDVNYDQSQIHRWREASEASGIEASKYPKWDAEQEREKFRHEPLEAFGSLGSVVGILASAFVHAPMESAFNASAAAMNAIKAGDDQAYDRAHTAWKENMDLVYKRHEMMRGEYQDATSLMLTDLRAGEAKLKTAAARFGDKRALALSEAGMDQQLYEYLDSQNKAVEGLRKINLETMEDTMKAKAYDGIASGIDQAAKQAQAETGQPVDPTEIAGRKLAAFNRIYKVEKETPAQQLMGTYFAQHPLATAEEAAAYAEKHNLVPRYGRGGSDEQLREMLRNDLGREPSVEEFAAAKKDVTGLTDRLRSADKRTEEINRHNEAIEAINQQRGDTSQQRADEAKRHNEAMEKLKTTGGNTQLTPERRIEADVQKARAKWIEEGKTDEEIAKLSADLSKSLKERNAAPSGNRVDDMKRREDQIETAIHHIDRAQGLLKKHNAITGIGGSILRRGETVVSVLGSNSTDWHEFESEVSTLKTLETRILTDSQGRPLASEGDLRDKIVRGLGAGDTKKITVERFVQLRQDLQDALARTRRRHGEGEGGDTPAKSSGKQPWESAPIVQPAAQ